MLKIYRASAGSGKTYRLTQDYIHLLFDPVNDATYRRILAVTFTNKATDEMKTRILKELHALAQGEKSPYRSDLMRTFKMSEVAVNDRSRNILIAILHDYSSFSISTIDRFFQQVIRSFAREIGVQGGYNLELDNESTLQQSVDNLFHDLSKDENRQLLNWLTQFAEDRIEQSENWNPRRSIEDLGKEIFKESYQDKAEDTNRKLHDRDFLRNYQAKLRKIQTDFEADIKTTAQNALDILTNNGLTPESFKGGTNSAMKTLNKILIGEFKLKDSFVNMVADVSNWYAKSAPKDTVAAIQNACNNGLQQKLQQILNLLTSGIVLYNSAIVILKHINTLGILSDLALQIKKLTEEQNSMLISDANMLLNRIIDNSETPFVYEKTGIHIDHFMIDEFQDTSALQWRNFFPLISNSLSSGKFNLVVGDVKQSIYRWRNSDWKLLDEKVMLDFRPEQIQTDDLKTNWRSDRNIVEFNNSFFACASQLLQQKLNLSLSSALTVYPHLLPLSQSIEHAYGQLQQEVSPKAGEGYVKINFIPQDENDEGWKAETLNRLPVLLEELQDRGYRPEDVGILVKKNDDAQKVIRKLLTHKSSAEAKPGYSYDIMGNEGLLISSAASVRFLVGILRLFVQPNDTIQQTIVDYEYARARLRLSETEALNACFPDKTEKNAFSQLFSDTENETLSQLKNNSLYEMVEQIIALFNLGMWHNEAIFIQAFQDLVYKFSTAKATDLYSFLKWWDKTGIRQSVSTPENAQAFRIMTIHKSKGLDFKVVIIPFCEWDVDKKSGRFKNVLWCVPTEAPFDELPLLPVEYASGLAETIFAENYLDELMHQYIDNLNVAYVAFTRARHELICFAPLADKAPESVEKIKSLSGLMHYSFNYSTDAPSSDQLTCNFNNDTATFCIGEPLEYKYTEPSPAETTMNVDQYVSISVTDRLKIKHISQDFWRKEQNMNESRLNFGIIMHDILRQIKIKSDQEKTINDMIRKGLINENESRIVRDELNKFWSLPHVNDWFSNDLQIINEASILSPEGDIYRPDRIVIQDKNATVVDYKFGETESKVHTQQVQQYMSLIRQMGYQVTGFLCYVSIAKVIEVELS